VDETPRDLQAFEVGTRPEDTAVARVRGRVLHSLDQAELAQARLVRRLTFVVPVAAAALVLLLFLIPRPTLLPGPGQPPLAVASEQDWSVLEPTREVRLDYHGEGALSGTREAPELVWRSGTVRASVAPDRGIELVVRTPESTVQVIGTVFQVTRSALGSETIVERGIVRVDCVLGGRAVLRRGGRHNCLPATAAGLLGRARRLQDDGAPASQALQALELARGRPDATGAVREEIAWVRVEVLAASGRRRAALTEARRLVAGGGGHRHDELLDTIERLSRWGRRR
jgi:ferric-dicitrate binding protein FerR (iron transport regulator)